MYEIQNDLLDNNLYETIIDCNIQSVGKGIMQIVVTYENGTKERIWTFNQSRYAFDVNDFIGKKKIESVFYCDRKEPRRF